MHTSIIPIFAACLLKQCGAEPEAQLETKH
jgi:hypothetical protein